VEILHVGLPVQQLAAVQHLAVALGLQAVQHFLRVARRPGSMRSPSSISSASRMALASLVRVPPASAFSALPTNCLRLDSVTSTGEGGVLRRDLGKLLVERQAGDDVDDVAEVDALVSAQAQLVAERHAFGPILQGLGLALVGDLKGGHLLFLQPLAHVAQASLALSR
jgi:hypothetical protein